MVWASLCQLGEIPSGRGKYVEIDGFKLAVFVSEGKPYVIDDACPHAGASLAAGQVVNGCAVCPRHDWAFNLATGAFKDYDGVCVSTYPVRTLNRNGVVWVQAQLPIY